uniref:Uncharacterized protein n=1 Tax=Anopheles coluzzii TaxID=1518534 RepID=A0A8W7PIY4_ANOCL
MAPPAPPLAGDLVDAGRGSTSTGVLSSSSLSCDDGVSFSMVAATKGRRMGDVGVVVIEVAVTFGPVPPTATVGTGPTGEVGMIWSGLVGDIMNCIGPSYACTSRPFRLTPDIGRTSCRSLACTMPGVARFWREQQPATEFTVSKHARKQRFVGPSINPSSAKQQSSVHDVRPSNSEAKQRGSNIDNNWNCVAWEPATINRGSAEQEKRTGNWANNHWKAEFGGNFLANGGKMIFK